VTRELPFLAERGERDDREELAATRVEPRAREHAP
jgi:hypothetical protein